MVRYKEILNIYPIKLYQNKESLMFKLIQKMVKKLYLQKKYQP